MPGNCSPNAELSRVCCLSLHRRWKGELPGTWLATTDLLQRPLSLLAPANGFKYNRHRGAKDALEAYRRIQMTEKPIIDCHHHLGRDPDYAAKLVDECAPAGNRGKAYLWHEDEWL